METEDKIYEAFLEELQQIEKFRAAHVELYQETPIDSEDPHTKRLIESLAFFGARARLQGTRKIVQLHQRLFRQYFPYLVNPLPSIGMLQLKPSLRYPEKVNLPMGAELAFKTTYNSKAFFQTLDPLTVFPLFPKRFEFDRRGDSGWRCVIEYASTHISTEEIGSFQLFINHLNSFISSLTVSFAMQYSLESVRVFYDASKINDEDGDLCSIEYGLVNEERKVFNHVLEQIRSFLHFPQQELFITLNVPPSGKRWQTLAFCFDFNGKWPENLRLNSDSFVPFVVPIVNLRQAYADPIIHDGYKENYSMMYPEPIHKFELHTVVNVSEVLSMGMKPMIPGMLGFGGDVYEIDYFEKEIRLDCVDAFKNPKTISIEALWAQPWFTNYMNDELDLQFSEAQVFGLDVKLLGSFQPYETTLKDDPDFLIQILSLKNQNYLSLNEVLFILKIMKNLNRSVFDSIPEMIKELRVNEKINHKLMSTVIEYEFYLKDWSSQKVEVAVLFFKYVHRLLNCWLPNFEIETKVHFTRSKKPLIFKRGSKNELSALARDFFLS